MDLTGILTQIGQLFLELVSEGCIQIAFGLYIIGEIIKATKKIPNSLIPVLLLITGIGGSLALGGEPTIVQDVLQGIYATGIAVLGNQMLKQGKEFHEYMMSDDNY